MTGEHTLSWPERDAALDHRWFLKIPFVFQNLRFVPVFLSFYALLSYFESFKLAGLATFAFAWCKQVIVNVRDLYVAWHGMTETETDDGKMARNTKTRN